MCRKVRRLFATLGVGIQVFVNVYYSLVLLLIVSSVIHGSNSGLSKSDIVISNNGITVPFGRSVFIDPENDLNINVLPGDRCVVSVQDNDPLTQRPGRVIPVDTFPCKFGAREVQYQHFGARMPNINLIKILIRYDTERETIIIPLNIHVTVQFVQLQLVSKNIPIATRELKGYSNALDYKNTGFIFDKINQVCKVTVMNGLSNNPQHGYVANDSIAMHNVDCDDFLKSNIKYKHSSSLTSPNKDYIPLLVQLYDMDGNLMQQEYFQKLVRIGNALENQPPRLSPNAAMIMEASSGSAVHQFIMTAIPPYVLAATDNETEDRLLVFNITVPLGPGEGEIVSTDDRDQPINSFLQGDIQDFKIAYKPPPTDSDASRSFLVDFEVVDLDGGVAGPFSLTIFVNPKQTMSPIVTTNRGIQLFEGQSRNISYQNLRISDEDNLNDVQVFIADGARHGELMFPNRQNYFTPSDLAAGRILYRHDGTDGHYSDNIVFTITDGQHNVEFLFPVIIFPIDDEPPYEVTNTGLDINQGELTQISQFQLSATDIDSDDMQILFVLEPPFSRESEIVLRQFAAPPDSSSWQFLNGIYEKSVNQFTQLDIVNGKVFYKHNGHHSSPSPVDTIRFSLTDNHDPPNRSIRTYNFNVQVSQVDRRPPYLYSDVDLKMEVEEFQMTSIKRKYLRYTDDDSKDRQLKYTITRGPFDTDTNTPLSAGNIVLCDDIGMNVRQFTQSQINHQQICYQPPTDEIGITPRLIQFVFSVSDINRNTIDNQIFTLDLKPINNRPPVIMNSGLQILENGRAMLTHPYLYVRDPDTPNEDLYFVLNTLPTHGVLQKEQQPLIVGDRFSKREVDDGHIIYVHNGDEAGYDEFNLGVSDGAHVVPIVVPVRIEPIDDEPPVLTGVDSNILELDVRCFEGEFVTLNSEHFSATDPDTDDLEITFWVKSPPTDGAIMVDGESKNSFTQAELFNNLVEYQHFHDEIGAVPVSDRFSLIVADSSVNTFVAGNHVAEIVVSVIIMPIDDITPTVLLGAPFEVLEGDKAPILPRHVDSMDNDTIDEKIQCIITIQPKFGYIENISPAPGSEKSRVGLPISAFHIKEVRLRKINFVQSIHKGVEERSDKFQFYCSDGINSSPEMTFPVLIYLTNDEAPEVFVREFSVMEGMEIKLDTPILNAVDKDLPPDELTFYITIPPQHGHIVQQRQFDTVPITQFTIDDIATHSNIMYQHDNTETTRDMFQFVVTDGLFNTTKQIPIAITPIDDETPRLSVNNGIRINDIDERVLITNRDLQAEDIDSPNLNITFIIRRIPKHGQFLLKQPGSFQNLTVGSRFTQLDIDNQNIYYKHRGLEATRDLATFDVTDGLNTLVDRYFYITVTGIDIVYPVVISNGVQLPEGGSVTLTTDVLSGSDANSPNEELFYTITSPPKDGFLESTDRPRFPILTFTQRDLAGNKIRYIHTTGSEVKMDHFNFELTDGNNRVNRMFRISISDVDNKKPVLMIGTLYVNEGGNKVISTFELNAIDQDSPSIRIGYTLIQVPLYGNILYNFSRVVTSFTQSDLDQGMISYQHDGSETISDNLALTVTDGVHSEFYILDDNNNPTGHPQNLRIQIMPVDNRVPQLTINKGVTNLDMLQGRGMQGRRLGVVITDNILKCEDRDSPPVELTFELKVNPTHGHLIHVDRSIDAVVTRWTQRK